MTRLFRSWLINARTALSLLDQSRDLCSLEIVRTVLSRLLVNSSDVAISRSKSFQINPIMLLFSSTIYLYAANDPIIEASSGLKFGPFNLGYPKLAE